MLKAILKTNFTSTHPPILPSFLPSFLLSFLYFFLYLFFFFSFTFVSVSQFIFWCSFPSFILGLFGISFLIYFFCFLAFFLLSEEHIKNIKISVFYGFLPFYFWTRPIQTDFNIAVRTGLLPHYKYKLLIVCYWNYNQTTNNSKCSIFLKE